MTNPLSPFLDQLPEITYLYSYADHYSRIRPDQMNAFLENEERLVFARDAIVRIKLIAFAYDRLCELRTEFEAINAEIAHFGPNASLTDLPPELRTRQARAWKEATVHYDLLYYELKSVTDMLLAWVTPNFGAELRYARELRNYFLAHPNLEGAMRGPRSLGYSCGEDRPHPVALSFSGLNSWAPLLRNSYLRKLSNGSDLELAKLQDPNSMELHRRLNEDTVLSRKQNKVASSTKDEKRSLTSTEICRIRAFGLREPNLEQVMNELCEALEESALPKIKKIFNLAVTDFHYGRRDLGAEWPF